MWPFLPAGQSGACSFRPVGFPDEPLHQKTHRFRPPNPSLVRPNGFGRRKSGLASRKANFFRFGLVVLASLTATFRSETQLFLAAPWSPSLSDRFRPFPASFRLTATDLVWFRSTRLNLAGRRDSQPFFLLISVERSCPRPAKSPCNVGPKRPKPDRPKSA